KHVVFWESMEEPSLKKFLDFRLKANDLNDRDTEHRQYKTELEIIKLPCVLIRYCATPTTRLVVTGTGKVATGCGKGYDLLSMEYVYYNGIPCWLRLVAGK
ncbi:11869_t:CDS:2, partial [Acaulospora morrowiae]